MLQQCADDETTLVALSLADQSMDCSGSCSTYKHQTSVLGSQQRGSEKTGQNEAVIF